MISIRDFVPSIAPVSEGVDRPFWSVMIPNYNCAHYLAETLKSVLRQDPGIENMQIEVVDDYSTKDDPEAVVREIGKGRVSFFRQPQNTGATSNFNTCIQRSKGKWVHILHSDDMLVPGFYERFRSAAEQETTIGAALCRHIYTDGDGQWQSLSRLERNTPGIIPDWLERIAVGQRVETPSIAVKRSVYEHLGGYHSELFHAADWEMWRRIAMHYPVWYEPEALAYYRVQSGSDTSRLYRTGANIADIRRSIEIAESYLPTTIVGKSSNIAKLNYALSAINLARRMLSRNDTEAAIALVWEGLKCSHSQTAIESLFTLIESTEAQTFLADLFSWGEQKEDITSQSILPSLRQALQTKTADFKKSLPTIIVDGVIFKFGNKEINQIWQNLLENWVKNGFAKHIILLDRAGTAPTIRGIKKYLLPHFGQNSTSSESEMLQRICDAQGADLFFSTYYTSSISTPYVFMAYNPATEPMKWELPNPMLLEKYLAIQQSSACISIFQNTACDIVKHFPEISLKSITVAQYGVSNIFFPANLEEINRLTLRYGISKPYLIITSFSHGSKTEAWLFEALSNLCTNQGFELVYAAAEHILEADLRDYIPGIVVHLLQLSDEELRTAYSGAIALVYPSKDEGLGLRLVEAMACGCPIITCDNLSNFEILGKAAIYVSREDVYGLADALCDVQKPNVRNLLIATGIEQAKNFSWSKMAKQVSYALIDATLLPLNLKDINLIIFPDWSASEEILGSELQRVFKAVATHPDKNQMTLLINTSNGSEEEANLLLSSVMMNCLMEEDLDVTDGLEISLIGQMSEIQWEALLPRINYRIILEKEEQQALLQVKAHIMPLCDLNSLNDEHTIQLTTRH